MAALVAVVVVVIGNPILWVVRKRRYFSSEEFQALRADVAALAAEHNDVVAYVDEIHAQGSFQLGTSSTGQHAHLATFTNTSS